MKNYAAFFDLDHTIIDANSGKLIARLAHQNGLFSTWDLITAALWSPFHDSRFLTPDRIIEKILKSFRNKSEERFSMLTTQVFDLHLKYTIGKNIISVIESHRAKNGHTVILSAALSYICNPVKDYLGMNDAICTKLEVIEGNFSGAIDGKYCYGEEKLFQAIRYCEAHNLSLDQAYFYSDSISDLPLLEKVGYPVCVKPEPGLARIAKIRSWPIFDT